MTVSRFAASGREPLKSDWEKLAHHFADQLVELWHADETGAAHLHEWMGLTEEQYAAWVECRFGEGAAVSATHPRVQRTNVRRLYEQAIVTGNDGLLLRVEKYLVGQGWIGGAPGQLNIEEAISAVERA